MKIALGADLLDGSRCGMRIALEQFLSGVKSEGLIHEVELWHAKELPGSDLAGFSEKLIPCGRFPGARLNWTQRTIPRLLRDSDVDLIHWPYQILPPVSVPVPQVISIWDLAPMSYPEPGWSRLSVELKYRQILRRAVRKASRVITHSQAVANEVCERLDVDPENVSVIYPGLSRRFSEEANSECVPNPAGDILYVGNDTPRKNLSLLLEAYARVQARGHTNRLVLRTTDDKAHRVRIQSKAQALKVDARYLKFVSATDVEGLIRLYRSASVLAFPSLYEGFGLPLIEAMACGLPVVGLNQSTIPEVVADCGVLADNDPKAFAAAISQLLSMDSNDREQLTLQCQQRAREFRWGDAVRKTWDVYRSAIENAQEARA